MPLENEIFYPQEIADNGYLADNIETLPVTELPFDILGGEKEVFSAIAERDMDSQLVTLYEIQQEISIDNPPVVENIFMDSEVPTEEINASENEFSPTIENKLFYEEVLNHDDSGANSSLFITDNKYSEMVAPYYSDKAITKSSGESFYNDEDFASGAFEVDSADNFSLFEQDGGQKGKEVHIHNEVPAINIEFSGNIEKDVDFEGLLHNMQKRIREEMEAGSDFSYSY